MTPYRLTDRETDLQRDGPTNRQIEKIALIYSDLKIYQTVSKIIFELNVNFLPIL